jgi:hypothetical protein
VLSLYFFSDNPRSHTKAETRKQISERYRTGKVRYRDIRYPPGPVKALDLLTFVVPTLIEEISQLLLRIMGDLPLKEKKIVGPAIVPRQ